MRIKYTAHKDEPNLMAFPDICCHRRFIASSDMQICFQLQFIKQISYLTPAKLIIKVGVANAIKTLLTTNLRKQFASTETSYNKMSLQKWISKIILEYQWASVETCSLLQMLAFLPTSFQYYTILKYVCSP